MQYFFFSVAGLGVVSQAGPAAYISCISVRRSYFSSVEEDIKAGLWNRCKSEALGRCLVRYITYADNKVSLGGTACSSCGMERNTLV